MRKIQKSLCFVMALVFVLGLCTIGAGAAFTDAAEINYDAPVTVMSGLGILKGYDDGSFKPGENVTRAQAAAMITRMMLGPENADKLPLGEVKFTDVSTDKWDGTMAKYINFCANKGIIVGMGDGTFHPEDPVTGTQLATMLLRAVGYGTMGEYEGKGWDINAVADALYYKIFDDAETKNFDLAATREECALYVFNTLTKVGQVQWDVDVNRYLPYDDPFGESVFHLLTRQNIGYAQILENQATGADYTVIRYYTWYSDSDGKYTRQANTLNLNYETGKDMIGHEVEVYFNSQYKEDKVNHVNYYDTYLIDDVSTVLEKGTTYNDFYRNLYVANKENASRRFTTIPTWIDYSWDNPDNDYYEDVAETDSAYDFVTNKYAKYYSRVSELKGQRSTNDNVRNISGDWILDHDGKILLVLDTTLSIGVVKSVDEYEIELKLKDGSTEYFEAKAGYDGIAKGDYATIERVGDLVYLHPTSVATAEIGSRMSFFGFWYFGSYAPDFDCLGITIPEQDDPAQVHVGDTVKFYMTDAGTYFGLQILDPATLDGIVFITYVKEVTGVTDEFGDPASAVYKVQAVNEAGEIVTYRVKADEYKKLAGGVDAENLGVYKAYKSGGTTTFVPEADSVFTKDYGKNSYLRDENDQGIYYVTSDTKVHYLGGKPGTKLTVTTTKKLTENKTKSDYTVYGVTRLSGGKYNLSTVWVLNVNAPAADPSESFIFVHGTYGVASPFWYLPLEGEETPQYSVYINGETNYIYVDPDSDGYALNPFSKEYTIDDGFYQFVEKDGIYTLSSYTKVQTDTLGGTEGYTFRAGKLYAEFADGITVKNAILDVSTDTTVETQRDTAINDLERLEELLADGYEVTITYVYKTSSGNRVPVGTIYVTNVVAPAD